jgi:hypothetical protein
VYSTVLFGFVSYSVFIVVAFVAVSCFCLGVCWCSDTCTAVFVFGSVACFCFSYFFHFYGLCSISSSFFVFYFCLSAQCILPLCLFSLSLCTPFALFFCCPSFSVFIFLLPLLHSTAVFVLLSLPVYYCLILWTRLYYNRHPHDLQNAITNISTVELGFSVMQFLTISVWLHALFCSIYSLIGARVGAVGWGSALQIGRSRVRSPILSLEFFIDITLPAALWPWGWHSL